MVAWSPAPELATSAQSTRGSASVCGDVPLTVNDIGHAEEGCKHFCY
jgi:hypothetical protein